MLATTYEITGKTREFPFGFADFSDFQLRESGQVAAEEILHNPHITLYTLDFENGRAVFVETSAETDLSQAPFYYLAQFENALRVLTVSLETMKALADSISIDDQRLIFVQSTGRAGSTLASKIFAQVDGVVNMSEPDALMSLIFARNNKLVDRTDLLGLLDAVIHLLCKTAAGTAWVIKGRSFAIELGDWLHDLYPRAKSIFLYRNAETFLGSSLRAYYDGDERTVEEVREMNNGLREYFKPLVPLLTSYDADQYLPGAGILSLMWLSVMEKYEQLHEHGVEMLAIRYENWHSVPRQTAVAMLEYCGCRPADLNAIYKILGEDSQAGTGLSQEAVQKQAGIFQATDLQELHRHLRNHAFINAPDYEVPNTLTTNGEQW